MELVEARCESLARRGLFLESLGSGTWPDGTEAARYGFVHALHQEVLYDRIPAGQRARWHRQIGLRLERGHGEAAREIAAELAEHFRRGRDAARAVPCLRQAGENARQRSAYGEAIAQLTRGIELLGLAPDTPERNGQEIDLQTSLGLTYMAARGYSAPEVGAAYGRARELCRQGDSPRLARILNGLWIFHLARGECRAAREVAEQMLALGRETNDPAILGPAHHGVGQVLFHVGEFAQAREHLERAFALYGRQALAAPDSIRSVQDGRVISLGFLALSLWHLGYPDEALRRAQEALALARELAHPFTLAYALFFACAMHGHRGEHAQALPHNEEMHALSSEHGFPAFLVAATFVRTLVLLAQGKTKLAEGIAQLRQCQDAHRATGAGGGHPALLAAIAELQMAAGQAEEAWASLSQARAAAEASGEGRYQVPLSLLEGKLLLVQAGGEASPRARTKAAEAEACLRRGAAIARQQASRSLELQAVTSLCRLWQQQGRGDEARELLAPAYGWFAEGLDTKDLREARALLDSLAAHHGPPGPRRDR